MTCDHRTVYRRDVDKIIHSKAYTRYVDKTQVVYLVEHDHITHRSLHVQLVSSYARGISAALNLDGDLVEAISLGHDIGHPPFGHEGEEYLNEIAKENGLYGFQHPVQSCRLAEMIEPLQLSFPVLDGFLCHDGAMTDPVIIPRIGKGEEGFRADVESRKRGENVIPGTLEGALVKLCDTISYVGRDIEDAITLNIITRDKIPETSLGRSNKEILAHLAEDLIESSRGGEKIALSPRAFQDLKLLRNFNFKAIYSHPPLKKESKKIKAAYSILFDLLLRDFSKEGEKSFVWKNFLSTKGSEYLKNSTDVEKVIDYISGMTDNYFLRTLNKFIVPQRIVLE
jgi:dGTPase